jgi:hypothetical protein
MDAHCDHYEPDTGGGPVDIMNILADLGTDIGILGGATMFFAFAGFVFFMVASISFFADCRSKGFTLERLEPACGCLCFALMCISLFPVTDMWTQSDIKAEAEAVIKDDDGLSAEEGTPIRAILVAVTIAITGLTMEGSRVKYAENQGTDFPPFYVIMIIPVAIIVGCIFASWLSGAYLSQ